MCCFGLTPKILFSLIILAIISIASFSSASALEIRIKDRAVVKEDVIYLGQIASFHPPNDDRVSWLQELKISSSPPPGIATRINKQLLFYKIDSHIAGMDDIQFYMPEELVVERSAQFVDSARLEEIFKEYIMDNSPWPPEKLYFEKILTPGRTALPLGRLRWEIQERRNNNFIGNIAITIGFWIDESLVREIPVSGRISISRKVIKAARKIDRGQIISQGDLMEITESYSSLKNNVLSSAEEVIGKRSLRSIRSGQIIYSHMVETPPLVKKGDRVLIKAENADLIITALGKALEDGRSGDQVKVINISSKKEIHARVTGPGLVEVTF
ncbi:MAG: flagellar basal body P-ring formation protein FlgA [Deltaproteobacteria bacterium]|nr:flagellar basal body P-ring formation protein FlgA [Deltaproteobacteria bacterium]